MLTEVAQAIMKGYEQSIRFKSELTGGLYFQQAPQDVLTPYGVFYITGGSRDEIMGTANSAVLEVSIQFNLFDDSDDGGETIALLTDLLCQTYDWQPMFVTGFHHVKMQPEGLLPITFTDGFWQGGATYSLGIQKQ